MTLDEILQSWKADSTIDRTELGDESLRIITLHAKYMELYRHEKLKLVKKRQLMNKLRMNKYEFYTMGPTEETKSLGWKLPPRGAVIKSEVQMYIDADDDIIRYNLNIAMAQEKVDLLLDIIKECNNRRWSIKAALDWLKWTSGG